ncbi:pyroglutamyl-peptidase I [Serinibacter salmoneus]|uniref:Pyrrolidone-carboxylate peptidase n=1 Tax=Serinibacter salmoneus TaxID=556530 RepID=A0A2A9D1L0_9MICO|nr:pyroglutamyl-peptidase I [Serinibacter salmoneus]PFG19739.1 pyroglutamyl-peptidase [Serinibacter salmoneus]
MTRTVLVTGFEPFGGDATNSSWEVAREVARTWEGPGVLVPERLPVTFAGAPLALREAITRVRPAVVLCLGLAAGTDRVRLERVAINLADARIPDNDGAQPVDEPVDPAGPAARFTTLPVKATLARAAERGLPLTSSLSAGSYVCNAVMYHALGLLPGAPVGFAHVPELRAEEDVADFAACVREALATALELGTADSRLIGGAIA